MIHFLTYSNDLMDISRRRCIESGSKHGANILYEFTPDDLDYNHPLKNEERGNGYWWWKPYLTDKVMEQAKDGDYVVYIDAGVEVIENLSHIINAMTQDIFLFTNGLQHADWCKADVMQAINSKQIEHQYTQVQASAIFIRVSQFSRNFIKEWLAYCNIPWMIDDTPSTIPNHPEFACHRYDQAILCCLAYKYNIVLHWWADARWFVNQRYRWPEDRYPPMFIHHRMRNNDYR